MTVLGNVIDCNLLFDTIEFLVSSRSALEDIPLLCVQDDISRAVNLKVLNAAKCDFDEFGIRSGREDKIIFETAPIAVIDHIDSGINLRVANASVVGNVTVPSRWIRAGKVITSGR